VKFICDEKEGWTPLIGKRSRHKVPTHLLRLRAPPHVCASLPSSNFTVLVRHLTRTAFSTFLLVLMFTTHLTVENQASGLQLRAVPVGLPFPQELDLHLNHCEGTGLHVFGYSCILCVSCNMITRTIIEKVMLAWSQTSFSVQDIQF